MALAKELVGVGISGGAAKVIPHGGIAAVTATSSSALATAVELAAGVNVVTGADGVRLPNCDAGSSVIVINDTASSLKIWPPLGGAIQIPGTSYALAVVGTAGTCTTYSTVEYICVTGGAASLWAINKSA